MGAVSNKLNVFEQQKKMFEKLRTLKPYEIENGIIESLDEIRQMLNSNIHLDPEIKRSTCQGKKQEGGGYPSLVAERDRRGHVHREDAKAQDQT